jgi:predicted hydrocarbon binding protein
MAAPRVDISVDPDTGAWSTDGMPMLYVPRHFLMGLLRNVREALGDEAAQRQFYTSCHEAAYRWCEMEARSTGLTGMPVFHHYMRRLSERGWGLFDGRGIDATTGTGRVLLRHSAFVAEAGRQGGKACGFCAGWAPGALSWVADTEKRGWRLTGRELRCAAEGNAACELVVEPA